MRKVFLSIIFLIFGITIYAQSPPIVYVAGDGSGDYNCDGTSDQVEINQALDFVAADSNYTTVYLKGPNTFWIDEPIFISENTTLEGDSNAVVKLIDHANWNTKYKPLIGQKGLTYTSELNDPGTTTGNITIRGFELDGNSENQSEPSGDSYYSAIVLQNCYNITINDMYIHNCLNDAFLTQYDEYGFNVNLQFYNNRIHDAGHDGIYVINCQNFEIHDNNFSDSRTDAHIRVQYCNHFKIYNNIAGNDPDRPYSGGIGISLQANGNTPVNDVEIYNNYFYGNGYYYGIWLWQTEGGGDLNTHRDVYIHNNIVSWYPYGAIGIEGFHNSRIENNVLECEQGQQGAHGGGIVFYGGDTVSNVTGFITKVKNNIILNNPTFGIDNQLPSISTFISDYNDIYGNLSGPYNNVSSTTDIYEDPKLKGTLFDSIYYNIIGPAWQNAHSNNDFSGDLGAKEAKLQYLPLSKVGRWDGSFWVKDTVTSICIDAGDPASEFSNEPIPNGERINIGAYGNTIYASKSEGEIVKIQCKIFLEGAYDISSHQMNLTLNSDIPKTSPYSEDLRSVGSVPPQAVDWILVQLRTTPSGSTITSKSVFINKDGELINDDGTSGYIELNVPDGEYYIVIKHRNHLAVMSKNAIALNGTTSTLYDFTTGSDKFYGTGGAKQLE